MNIAILSLKLSENLTVCKGLNGELCNIWGTKDCLFYQQSERQTYCKCKDGYKNESCSFCDDFFHPSKGSPGEINQYGEGILCKGE